MAYNNCNECPHYKKDSCPFVKWSDNLKRSMCPSLKLQIKNVPDLGTEADELANKLLRRLEVIHNSMSKPIDYNRDDTRDIAAGFDPNCN